jgi:hypothetical protein
LWFRQVEPRAVKLVRRMRTCAKEVEAARRKSERVDEKYEKKEERIDVSTSEESVGEGVISEEGDAVDLDSEETIEEESNDDEGSESVESSEEEVDEGERLVAIVSCTNENVTVEREGMEGGYPLIAVASA